MEALAGLANASANAVADALKDLPALYETWIASQEVGIPAIAGAPRQTTAKRLILSARQARDRIAAGVELLRTDAYARLAFRAMNEAVARARAPRKDWLSVRRRACMWTSASAEAPRVNPSPRRSLRWTARSPPP